MALLVISLLRALVWTGALVAEERAVLDRAMTTVRQSMQK